MAAKRDFKIQFYKISFSDDTEHLPLRGSWRDERDPGHPKAEGDPHGRLKQHQDSQPQHSLQGGSLTEGDGEVHIYLYIYLLQGGSLIEGDGEVQY